MNFLLLPWRILRWLWQKLRAFARWLRQLIARFFAAPADAVRRVLKRFVDFVRRVAEAIIAGWERIWSRTPIPRDRHRPHHLQACLVLATLSSVLACYATPLARAVHMASATRFDLLVVLIFVVGFLVFARWSTTDLETWWVDQLWRIRQRTGLVAIERAGAVLSLLVLVGFSFAGSRRNAHLRVPEVLILLTFIVLLADEYHERSSSRVPGFAPPTVDDNEQSDVPTRYFRWTLHAGDLSHDCDLKISLDEQRCNAMRERNPVTGFDASGRARFEEWVVNGSTPEIDVIAGTFGRWCSNNSWSQYVEVCLALSFAQQFPYRLDEESKGVPDYWRYPLETLVDGEGDCEDMSILAAAILRRMGHTVGIFFTDDHAALAVSAPPGVLTGQSLQVDGRRYYYCETTAEGWKVGELPSGVDVADLRISLMDDRAGEGLAA